VLTCKEQAEQPFTLVVPPEGPPEFLSSLRITKDQDTRLCGGLIMDPRVKSGEDDEILMQLPIKNETEYIWRGTVSLQLGKTSIPVDIGEIPAGETRSDTVDFSLDEGTHELNGSLLIGP
jgi:hypothetical protein